MVDLKVERLVIVYLHQLSSVKEPVMIAIEIQGKIVMPAKGCIDIFYKPTTTGLSSGRRLTCMHNPTISFSSTLDIAVQFS
jgi:hypothetical protein